MGGLFFDLDAPRRSRGRVCLRKTAAGIESSKTAGRAAEAWFYEVTEAGKVVMAARQAIKDAEGPFPVWFYMAPGHR